MTRPAAVTASIATVAAVYALRLDPAAGLYVDDAWYIVLAEALSKGEGFRLISSAAAPILPAFPPGFPMLLTPVVAAFPVFPDNVVPLKMISLLAMAGIGVAVYRYVARCYEAPPAVAAGVAAITLLMPAFVFLATSTVMAEPAFTLAQLGFALTVEWVRRRPASSMRDAVICGVVAGATLLIRLAGIAAVAAGVVYLGRHRGWRTAALVAAVAAICYAPWAIYSSANRGSLAERQEHGGSIAYGYDELLLMRHGGEPSSGRVTLLDMPGRVAFNAVNIFGRDAGAFVFPGAYRGAHESGLEVFMLSGETGFRATGMGGGGVVLLVALPISAVALIGFAARVRRRATVAEYIVPLTIAMVMLVPARTFRYVLPLTPFILFFFFTGIDAIARLVRRGRSSDRSESVPPLRTTAPFRIAASCILVLMLLEHVQYIVAARVGPQPVWLRDYEEVTSVTDWINTHLPDRSPIASSNPGLVYLATGRKTVALMNPRTHIEEWRQLGVRYAAVLHMAEPPPAWLGFRPLYESPRLNLWVMELPAQAPGAFDRK